VELAWEDCGGGKITGVVIAGKSLGKFMGFYRKGGQRNSKKALTPGSKHSPARRVVSTHFASGEQGRMVVVTVGNSAELVEGERVQQVG